jgi:predicted outer membrane repeat protein
MNDSHSWRSRPGVFFVILVLALGGCDAASSDETKVQVVGEALSTAVCEVAAEWTTLSLVCPAGAVIQSVDFASYGLPSGTCGGLVEDSGCHATTSHDIVSRACVGRSTCSVAATNTTFGDPCVGKVKQLSVQVSCLATSTDGTGGTTAPPEGGGTPIGSQARSCRTGVPVRGNPADVSRPTSVVGTGTPTSCTFAQLQAAVARGGVITFDCGSAPITMSVSSTMSLPTTRNTVIDGGNKITLDGRRAVQILRFDSPDFRANDNGLTLQHIALINGRTTPRVAIPLAPEPCSQGWNDGEGGALYMRDGNLTVIDATFTNNQAALLGTDTGGGAIYADRAR